MDEGRRAVKANLNQLPGIAAFNDDFRDAMKGNHSNKKTNGFVSGLDLREEAVKFGVVGAVHHAQIVYDYVGTSKKPWATQPEQCVNYASCHDNYTLWDKLKSSCPKATDEEMRKMVKLAGALGTYFTGNSVFTLGRGILPYQRRKSKFIQVARFGKSN
jgi:pullulanase